MKEYKLNIDFDKLFPRGISKKELKKLQEQNKLTSLDVSGFEFGGNFKAHICNLTGPIYLSGVAFDLDKIDSII